MVNHHFSGGGRDLGKPGGGGVADFFRKHKGGPCWFSGTGFWRTGISPTPPHFGGPAGPQFFPRQITGGGFWGKKWFFLGGGTPKCEGGGQFLVRGEGGGFFWGTGKSGI